MRADVRICAVCEHTQAIDDIRAHSCAGVLRNRVLELKTLLAIRDTQLFTANATISTMHAIAGHDDRKPVDAVMGISRYARRMADLSSGNYDRGTRTTALLAIQIVRQGGSRRRIMKRLLDLAGRID
jgi:hypothetical protein